MRLSISILDAKSYDDQSNSTACVIFRLSYFSQGRLLASVIKQLDEMNSMQVLLLKIQPRCHLLERTHRQP